MLRLTSRLPTLCAGALLAVALGACTDKLLHNHASEANAAEADARHKLQHKLLHRLSRLMEGSYSSAQQATNDPEKEYKAMRLHVKRIWRNRSEEEGLYYYVEQALATDPLHPAQQRVYQLRLRPSDDKIENVIYSLRRPGHYVGQWEEKEALVGLSPDSLIISSGCALIMYQNTGGEDGFRGVTEGRDCADPRKGAAYTTTDLTVSPTQIIWWERGFDLTDKPVWGPKSGGYIFVKGVKKTPKSSDGPTPTKS